MFDKILFEKEFYDIMFSRNSFFKMNKAYIIRFNKSLLSKNH